jgi:hypothetical protein
MRKLLIVLAVVSLLFFGVNTAALADSTGNHGQPSQSCEDQSSAPGGQTDGSNPGSPFAGGVSDSHYGGSAPQNSNNPKSVSQYDVACFQVSNH